MEPGLETTHRKREIPTCWLLDECVVGVCVVGVEAVEAVFPLPPLPSSDRESLDITLLKDSAKLFKIMF